MAVFISAQTLSFDEIPRQRPSYDNVRRPLRGIQIKEDTYAVLRARTATGDDIPLFDSGSSSVTDGIGRSTQWSNFVIQQLQEQRAEKQQIIETFGEDYIFFFGERPRFLNVSGILLNTKDFNWKSEFWQNYESYLRGTRLVEQNARMYLYFDDVVVEGYIIGAATTQSSDSPYHLPFQFQMFVTNYAVLSTVGSVYFQSVQAGEDASFNGLIAGLAAEDPTSQAGLATQTVAQGAAGGLNGFLTDAQRFSRDASFTIQNTISNIANTFYGRSVSVPDGAGGYALVSPVTNQASFAPAPTNRPIHEMRDEYVTAVLPDAQFDQAEIQRLSKINDMNTPEQLAKRARAIFEAHGIDTSRRETEYLMLGRGAFAALQTIGSVGIRPAGGGFLPLG